MSIKEITKENLLKAINTIVKKYSVEVVYLFGSKADNNKIKEVNDIDIGILLSKDYQKTESSSFGHEIDIETELQERLNLFEKIDVMIL